MRDRVLRRLEADPEVDASAVGVAAWNGAVTLTGYLDSYPSKLAAERAAKRVPGVRAVANEIDVRLKLPRADVEIAQNVVRALRFHGAIPEDVQAAVHNGLVTLTGQVEWPFQKRVSEEAACHLKGVWRVTLS
jgi:osmotically-inducible protein OsmY